MNFWLRLSLISSDTSGSFAIILSKTSEVTIFFCAKILYNSLALDVIFSDFIFSEGFILTNVLKISSQLFAFMCFPFSFNKNSIVCILRTGLFSAKIGLIISVASSFSPNSLSFFSNSSNVF